MFIKDEKGNHSSIVGRLGDGFWKNIFRRKTPRDDNIQTLLRQVPLFEGMNTSELSEFEKILHRRRFRRKEAIFRESEPGVGMFVIKSGTVGIYQRGADRKQQELTRLSQGEFFGELALLQESPRSATAVAIQKATILGLFRPDLMRLVDRQPRLGSKFLLQLASVIGQRLTHLNLQFHAVRSDSDSSQMIT
ncbi:cyclic nucleotide-binding domain-containing protein [bacterium]|nr:cyclic nucleotide-binding domain-containing protein [bacterium]